MRIHEVIASTLRRGSHRAGSAIVGFSHFERKPADQGPNRGLRIGGGLRTAVVPIYLEHEGGPDRTLQETLDVKHGREAIRFPFDDPVSPSE